MAATRPAMRLGIRRAGDLLDQCAIQAAETAREPLPGWGEIPSRCVASALSLGDLTFSHVDPAVYRHCLQHSTVVRDEEQRARIGLKRGFELLDGGQV
jgi:hypothetical protein